jgi:Aspartyl/Asparaginyl beta-hydroxylase
MSWQREVAALLASYAKGYHAGAFATPRWSELDRIEVLDLNAGGERFVATVARPCSHSTRHDWTGRPFLIPAGTTVITHLARTPGATVPDAINRAGLVFAFVEDDVVTAAMRAWGREVVATQISASSAITVAWGRSGERWVEWEVDRVNLAVAPSFVAEAARERMLWELGRLGGWADDYPYYSDGTWSALSLRGFRADDPSWGVKPAEMPRRWQQDHPEAMAYRVGWTVLAQTCPTMREAAEGLGRLERVRLMRMAGRDGVEGRLSRHCDITDRAHGTRDGMIARFHLPLVSDPGVRTHAWDLSGRHVSAHLDEGRWFYLDARKPHAVTNPAPTDRVHLVADVIVDARTRDLILSCRPVT